jgi:hypothetical protein
MDGHDHDSPVMFPDGLPHAFPHRGQIHIAHSVEVGGASAPNPCLAPSSPPLSSSTDPDRQLGLDLSFPNRREARVV